MHNGSSLFTGDAGQGESNIRRWIIENDWLEAIVALPLNMFYNTGIATYIWVLTNRKPAHRRGQGAAHRRHAVVQAAAQEPRQEELRAVRRGHRAHLRHVPRLRGDRAVEDLPQRRLRLLEGDGRAAAAAARASTPTAPTRRRRSRRSRRPPSATRPRRRSSGRSTRRAPQPDPLHGLFAATIDGKPCVVEYEPDSDLRDTEQVPLLEEGGIEAFIHREVLPHAPDAWYDPTSVKIGYEISFTRYFYKPQPLRTLEEIRADILALEKETEGLLGEIIGRRGDDRRPQALSRIQGLRRAVAGGGAGALGGAARNGAVRQRRRDRTCRRRSETVAVVSSYGRCRQVDADKQSTDSFRRVTRATRSCEPGDIVVQHDLQDVARGAVGVVASRWHRQPGLRRVFDRARAADCRVLRLPVPSTPVRS